MSVLFFPCLPFEVLQLLGQKTTLSIGIYSDFLLILLMDSEQLHIWKDSSSDVSETSKLYYVFYSNRFGHIVILRAVTLF